MGMMIEAVREPARRQLLLATDGRSDVGALAARTGIERTGHPLPKLKLIGLVLSRRQGKHVCYECAPGRVRADRGPDGLSLTVTHGSGVSVTISVRTATADAAAP